MHDNSIYSGVIPALFRAMSVSLKSGARMEDVAIAQGAPQAAVRILKSAVGAGVLSDPAWANNLTDMNGASQLFLQQLGGRSAFAALIDQGIITRAPLNSNVGSATTGAVASVVDPGDAKPVSKLAIASGKIDRQKAVALTVLSREVLENTSAPGQSFVNRQLRRAIGKALDVGIASSLISGLTPQVATNPDGDIRFLLDAVNTGEGRLAWVAAADVANRISVLDMSQGRTSPEGVSEFLNLPFAVSSGLPDGMLILLDGDQVVGNIESLGVEISQHATVEMDTAPAHESVTPTPASLVSLFQTDSIGLLLSAHFGIARGTDAALAVVTGITTDTGSNW